MKGATVSRGTEQMGQKTTATLAVLANYMSVRWWRVRSHQKNSLVGSGTQ